LAQHRCGPVYFEGYYLGDDPDPFIRAMIQRDLGAKFGDPDWAGDHARRDLIFPARSGELAAAGRQQPDAPGGSAMLRTIAAFDRIGEENAFAVLARAMQLAAAGRDIINLGIGQPDFRTPDFIVEAAVKALRDGHHGYTPAVGIVALREAVAADLGNRFKVKVSPDEVMILPGGKPTMFMSIMMFGEPGADILYPDPGFPIYRSMIEFTGARPIPVPIREENNFAFSAEETLKLITPRTRLLIVNSPANPTGGVTPKSEVDKLIAGLERFPDVAVMSDEIYDHMVYDGEKHVCLLGYPSIRDRLILLNGWSKTYAMTGWRLGYAVWPGKLYDYARKLAVNLHSCVNAPTQYAGLAALTGPQDEVAKMVAEFDRRRKVVVAGLNKLPGISCATPKGAFYAFPNIKRTGWKAKALASSLLDDAGVALIGGPDFGVLGEGYLRLSYANSTENILKALDRMGEFLASRKAA
jgi:aspartate/methionine/tyrosine aminotransferase